MIKYHLVHSVNSPLTRDGRDGWLKLNSDGPVSGRSKGRYTKISLHGPLYVGGVPDGGAAPKNAVVGVIRRKSGAVKAFQGCVKSLKVDGKPYDFRQEPRGAFWCVCVSSLFVFVFAWQSCLVRLLSLSLCSSSCLCQVFVPPPVTSVLTNSNKCE